MNIALCTSPHLDHSVFHARDFASSKAPSRPAQTFTPMGLLSIAGAVAPVAGPVILDLNKAINAGAIALSRDFHERAAEWIVGQEPELVGFMTEADSYHHVIKIVEKLKERNPEVTTLLGGVHATAVHRDTLEHFAAVDFVIRGEGELAFRSLIECLIQGGDLARVGNLTYRRSGFVCSNPEAPLIQNLDTLPWPDLARIDLRAEDAIYVEIGRGCPFKCSFCFTAPYWKRKHRIKSAERVMAELRHLREEHGRTDFNFTHDLFTTDRRWVLDFCRALADSDLGVSWTCSSRTDTLDEEQIEWMARAGCRNIYFGVEAGTAEMQARIAKKLDLTEARQIIARTAAAGIGVTVGFIAGLPGETPETLRGTLAEGFHYLELPGATVHVFGFSPYRGSPDFTEVRPGLRFDPHFLDFPVPDELHRDTCRWMEEHFDIFARYSRLSYDSLESEVIRAAEELFPIVNGIPRIFRFSQVIDDPLALVRAWSGWIEHANRRRGRLGSGLFQGSIDDFLAFLPVYLRDRGALDERIAECIRWESMKRALERLDAPVPAAPAGEGTDAVYTNLSAALSGFRVPHLFLEQVDGVLAGTFAFYKLPGGTPRIVRVPPLGALALELATNGIARAALVDALSAGSGEASEQREAVAGMLDELERVQLLLRG